MMTLTTALGEDQLASELAADQCLTLEQAVAAAEAMPPPLLPRQQADLNVAFMIG
jgi:hypothetical protein